LRERLPRAGQLGYRSGMQTVGLSAVAYALPDACESSKDVAL